MFGNIEYDPSLAYPSIPIEEQLEALHKAVDSGKVRYIGLSNETPWGLMKFCTTTTTLSTANSSLNPISSVTTLRPISLQNAYNLTCRTFDSSGLAECCLKEDISLLAYSPLAMGLLTGKYIDMKNSPPEARLNKYKGRYAEAESRYGPKVNVHVAVAEYADVAEEYGMSLTELALRFVLEHPLVASAVIGATGVEQLKELVAFAGRLKIQGKLDEKIKSAVDAIHARYPNPTP
jgi:N-acetyltransferase 10